MTNWLSREMTFGWTVRTILLVLFGYYLWTTGLFALYGALGVLDDLVAASPNVGLEISWSVWGWMVLQVLFEELFFRFPLCYIARLIPKMVRVRFWILLSVTLAMSCFFGWMHGGWLFVPVQGMIGLGFSLLCLKSGGFNGKIIKPMLVCWIAHIILNSALFVLVVFQS